METDSPVTERPFAPVTEEEGDKWRDGTVSVSAADAGRLVATIDALRSENTLLRQAFECQRETLDMALEHVDNIGEGLKNMGTVMGHIGQSLGDMDESIDDLSRLTKPWWQWRRQHGYQR